MTLANKLVGLVVLGVAATLPLAISCGGAAPEAVTPAAPAPTAPAETATSPTPAATTPPPTTPAPATTAPTAGATVAWKDMNHDQRVDFMKTTVLPKMKAEFAAYDGKKFGNITCGTCHGDGAKEGTFKMPNPKIKPRIGNDMPSFEKLMKDRPDAVKFMSTKVVPDMAQMLGQEPFDPKTGKGFGCHACHTAPDK